jgi:hypothetical protein
MLLSLNAGIITKKKPHLVKDAAVNAVAIADSVVVTSDLNLAAW